MHKFYILRIGLNQTSAGTVDYTGGEKVSTNLLEDRLSAKPEAHESLLMGSSLQTKYNPYGAFNH